MRTFLFVVEALLYVIAVLGLVVGFVTVAIFSPGPETADSTATAVLSTMASIYAAIPALLLGVIALAGAGTLTALERIRRQGERLLSERR